MIAGFANTSPPDSLTLRQPGWIDLQQLVGRCMGNLALADQIILKFLSGLENKITCLRISARCQDVEEIRRTAHRLKGEALTIGAGELADLAAKTELAAKDQPAVAAIEFAQALATLCETVRHEAFTFGSLRETARN